MHFKAGHLQIHQILKLIYLGAFFCVLSRHGISPGQRPTPTCELDSSCIRWQPERRFASAGLNWWKRWLSGVNNSSLDHSSCNTVQWSSVLWLWPRNSSLLHLKCMEIEKRQKYLRAHNMSFGVHSLTILAMGQRVKRTPMARIAVIVKYDAVTRTTEEPVGPLWINSQRIGDFMQSS